MAPRRYEVRWSQAAYDDLYAILEFIESDNAAAAGSVRERILRAALALDLHPNRGRIVPELSIHGIEHCREIVLAPWRIVYEIRNAVVQILMVVDSRRNMEDLLIERILRKGSR